MSGFDLVYAEALDRISRDQEDIAGIFKRLAITKSRFLLSRKERSMNSI